MTDIKRKAKHGMFWSFLNQGSTQLINFVITLLLARILMPEDFGLIGIVSIFIAIGKSLTDAGFSSSLIRSKNVDEEDFSTIFFINLFSSIFLYLIVFISAPYIAVFFSKPELENLIKMMGLIFIINASTLVQSTKLNKSLMFKEQFKLQTVALFISSSIAIYMALNDFGVWSLVVKDLSYGFFASIQLWFYSKWIPKLNISIKKLKYHFNFGYKLLLADILSKIFNNSYNIIIGKFVSTYQLGLFTRAKSMQELPNNIIFNSINRVLYPLLAEVNDNDVKLKNVYRQIMSIVAIVTIPILIFLSIVAKPLFIFLLTEKWNGAIPYFQILIIIALISPFQQYNLNICKIKGRSDLVLKISVIQYFLIALSLFCIIPFGINGLLWGMVLANFGTVVITSLLAGNLISYTIKEQLIDLLKPFLLSSIVGFVTFLLLNYTLIVYFNNFYILSISTIIFFGLYFLLSFIFNKEKLFYIYYLVINKK
ncbi:lipopolysaccharide biosynthesis protein [Empedobacter falsenii]